METDGEFCLKHQMPKRLEAKPFNLGFFSFCEKCAEQADGEDQIKASLEAKRVEQQRINEKLENAMLSKRFLDKTFENYRLDHEGQREALQKAKNFLSTMDSGICLILSGSNGTGKNHLSSAIVREAISKHRKTALITTAMKIIRAMRESWGGSGVKESQVLKSFVAPDVLVIDEVGVQYGTASEILTLTELINDRYNEMKPTIILTNLTPEELSNFVGARVVDKCREGGSCVVMKWPSYRLNAL